MFDKTRVLATGRLLIGGNDVGQIGRSLSDLMAETRTELIIVAYRFTIAVQDFREAFERVLSRGCRVCLVLDCPPEAASDDSSNEYLHRKIVEFPNLEVWDFLGTPVQGSSVGHVGQLHAKVVVADRRKAVVGSANFSRNGLLENHEIAVLVQGKPALAVAKSVDRMLSDGRANGILRKRER